MSWMNEFVVLSPNIWLASSRQNTSFSFAVTPDPAFDFGCKINLRHRWLHFSRTLVVNTWPLREERLLRKDPWNRGCFRWRRCSCEYTRDISGQSGHLSAKVQRDQKEFDNFITSCTPQRSQGGVVLLRPSRNSGGAARDSDRIRRAQTYVS